MKHQIKKITLKNGSELLIINVPNSEACFFGFSVRAGSVFSSKEKAEIAHLLEHMSFFGNKKYPDKDIFAFEAEKNGIYLNARTARNTINYTYLAGKDYLDKAIDLSLAQIIAPILNQAAFNSEKEVIRRELEPYLDQIYEKCGENLYHIVNPYRPRTSERLDSLGNIELKDVQDYYKKYFVSNNTKFLLSGSFTDSEIKNITGKIDEMLTDFPDGPAQKIIIHKPKKFARKTIAEDSKRAERNSFDLTFVNPNFSDRHSPEVKIFSVMFNEGTYSRLFRLSREMGISYRIRSDYSLDKDYSEFFIADTSPKDQSLKIFDLALSQLKEFIGGNFSDEELERAKGISGEVTNVG